MIGRGDETGSSCLKDQVAQISGTMNVARRGALGRRCDDEIGYRRRVDQQTGRIDNRATPFRLNRCASKTFEFSA